MSGDFHRHEKLLEETRENDSEATISEEAEMKRNFNEIRSA